jgi:dimethylamine/trimethylamine dehydrogenase
MVYTLEQPRVVSAWLKSGVRMHPNTTTLFWIDGKLILVGSDTEQSVAPIAAAILVAVTARMPSQELQELEGENVTRIGDCVAPGLIQAAVFSGHLAARIYLRPGSIGSRYLRETPVLF